MSLMSVAWRQSAVKAAEDKASAAESKFVQVCLCMCVWVWVCGCVCGWVCVGVCVYVLARIRFATR